MTATNAPNPYAPPKTRVVDHEPESHGLKHRSVLMAIVFTIVTFGFYFLIWWFRRRPGLNRLNSPKKISLWPLLLVIVLYVVQFVVAFMQEAAPDALSPAVGLAASIFQIFKLSGVMTFFFSIFYLQWAINRYVIAAQR
jgi:hypothetical protein